MAFSWVPFYRELAERVLEFENRQDELLAVLREMQKEGLKTVPLDDDLSPTERVPLQELEPFTFMEMWVLYPTLGEVNVAPEPRETWNGGRLRRVPVRVCTWNSPGDALDLSGESALKSA